MALIHCNVNSKVLKTSTSFYVILPESDAIHSGTGKLQTLYLLHGLGDDHSKWIRRTPLERYAKQYDLAIVMPQVGRSFYTDMCYGNRYWTFVSEELPSIVRSFFPLSEKMEDHFAAGLSMGGYGSFKLALNKPDCFAAVASFSGALDIANLFLPENEGNKDEFSKLADAIFGGVDKISGTKNDLFYLAKQLKESGKRIPMLYQSCGTEDPIYKYNETFHRFAENEGINLTYEEWSGGHDWIFWDQSIQRALEWFPLRKVQ
ncbi:alpha/beta hydrolase [Sporolactobacillus vineae]|uniref:alpha/beta hydrolase n=1 Tax=Sporolactobacillus vineae TaxID=444463 RepID=UPI000287F0C4|nr:alpha/beta hydrolase family protein [Sporolactobacillus vineae]